jgi:hypothetical protein
MFRDESEIYKCYTRNCYFYIKLNFLFILLLLLTIYINYGNVHGLSLVHSVISWKYIGLNISGIHNCSKNLRMIMVKYIRKLGKGQSD